MEATLNKAAFAAVIDSSLRFFLLLNTNSERDK